MGKTSLRKETDGQEQKEETKISKKSHHLAKKQKNPKGGCTHTPETRPRRESPPKKNPTETRRDQI
jgi:hypothetical protein